MIPETCLLLELWHKRFGYTNSTDINKIKIGTVQGLDYPANFFTNKTDCEKEVWRNTLTILSNITVQLRDEIELLLTLQGAYYLKQNWINCQHNSALKDLGLVRIFGITVSRIRNKRAICIWASQKLLKVRKSYRNELDDQRSTRKNKFSGRDNWDKDESNTDSEESTKTKEGLLKT